MVKTINDLHGTQHKAMNPYREWQFYKNRDFVKSLLDLGHTVICEKFIAVVTIPVGAVVRRLM